MSAWIVSKRHIDALVTGLISLEILPETRATTAGQLLWEENHKSVNHRYGRTDPTPVYEYERLVIHPASLLKQFSCYNYQTCEHPAYFKSLPDNLVEAARTKLSAWENTPEEDAAPWGIE